MIRISVTYNGREFCYGNVEVKNEDGDDAEMTPEKLIAVSRAALLMVASDLETPCETLLETAESALATRH